jgi:hypothetical protein
MQHPCRYHYYIRLLNDQDLKFSPQDSLFLFKTIEHPNVIICKQKEISQNE